MRMITKRQSMEKIFKKKWNEMDDDNEENE